jgi:hypothetical protein
LGGGVCFGVFSPTPPPGGLPLPSGGGGGGGGGGGYWGGIWVGRFHMTKTGAPPPPPPPSFMSAGGKLRGPWLAWKANPLHLRSTESSQRTTDTYNAVLSAER